MSNSKQIKKSIADITEITLMLAAFGIVIEILFGDTVPVFGSILTNLMGMVRTLGQNGLIGLATLGFVVYLFRRAKVFA